MLYGCEEVKEPNIKAGVKQSDSSILRGRPSGWIPLAYPLSALFVPSDSQNPLPQARETSLFFPLDKDVLRAAVRELLILDGSLDSVTLKLKREVVKLESNTNPAIQPYALGPNYIIHLEVGKWKKLGREKSCYEDNSFNTKSQKLDGTKRKLQSFNHHHHEKTKKSKSIELNSKSRDCNESYLEIEPVYIDANSFSSCIAETLVDVIVDRAGLNGKQNLLEIGDESNSEGVGKLLDTTSSNVKKESIKNNNPAKNNETLDLSSFIDINHRNENGSIILLRSELPSLIHTSIASEMSLRSIALTMVTNMCMSFESAALRDFLGYKTSSMTRDRLLRILSDYLFDISHAIFAWKQTESEIVSERSNSFLPSQTSYCQGMDGLVRNSLFDARALKKIGGIDESSILRHAIEISRSELRNESWETFATSVTGRRLLSHHKNGKAMLVGQKRRGHRVRQYQRFTFSEILGSSSSSQVSSITSQIGIHNSKMNSVTTDSSDFAEHSDILDESSEIIKVNLIREVGENWGFLLSREGDICLVERATEKYSLQCGDILLSVQNEKGELVGPPVSKAENQNPNWFQNIVNMFMENSCLCVEVRRMGYN